MMSAMDTAWSERRGGDLGAQSGESVRPDRAVPRGRSVRRPAASADLTDAVAAARAGDERAFHVVYQNVQPRLLRYLRTLVGEDAEDVASEAWSQIARDLPSFDGDGDGFRGWAATIARHRALDHLRRLRRRPATAVPVEQISDRAGTDDTEGEALALVQTDAAVALIATLPRDQAEAVMLRVVMGLGAQAAGKVLGKRAGAVRSATHRGLRRLAAQLERSSGAADADMPPDHDLPPHA